MPELILAPIFDQINLFLLNLVRKEVDFSSETFETFTRDLSQFLASMGRNLLELFLDLNQPSDNQIGQQCVMAVYRQKNGRSCRYNSFLQDRSCPHQSAESK